MSDIALRYFYATAVHGSMRAASLQMNVAVSSISRQIAQLEQALGMTLLETGRRSVKLTPAGQITFDYYQSRLAEQESFVARLDALRELKTGTVELAVGEGVSIEAFDPLLDAFRKGHPGVEIVVSDVSNDALVGLMLDDEAHIGVGVGIPEDPKVRVRATAPQGFVALCRPDHPLAERTSVGLCELSSHQLCLPMKGSRLRAALRAAEKQCDVTLTSVVTSNSVDAMRKSALQGRGVAILPEIAARSDVERGDLVAVRLNDVDPQAHGVSLVTRLGRQLPSAPILALSLLEQQIRRWSAGARYFDAPVLPVLEAPAQRVKLPVSHRFAATAFGV
ncbi:MAG: LysR family transcriptional regulator [Caulobacter sp.]|nr:LysR family transcriptional regulator [Caulobacter sp.]